MIQGSEEWVRARLGKVTASRISDVVAKTKNGYGASRDKYMGQLIAERLTGVAADQYTNAAMQWGVATEPRARAAYCFENDCEVLEVGFVEHPAIDMTGASPDGLVGNDGMVEIKCPDTHTHIATLLDAQPIKSDYVLQMQWQMACAGGKWCDFVSFDPRMPPEMQLFVQRVKKDSNIIAELEREVHAFLKELDAKLDALTNRYRRAAA